MTLVSRDDLLIVLFKGGHLLGILLVEQLLKGFSSLGRLSAKNKTIPNKLIVYTIIYVSNRVSFISVSLNEMIYVSISIYSIRTESSSG